MNPLNVMERVHKEPGLTSFQRAFDDIDQYAEQLMKEENIPGLAIAVTDRESLLRVSTYGVADVATQLPVSPDTRFEIGSLGKQFTSIALLQLRDEGLLNLHAPVTDYLPWFEVQSEYRPITVHHLMNHTAGLVRGTDLAPHGLYESWALRQMKVCRPPGTCCSYSNIGYKTLGFLLEELTRKPLSELIQSRVLTPLGMTNSYPAISHETRQKAATGYGGFYDDRPQHPSHGLATAIWAEYGTGDGCQVSTVSDMATYLRMFLNRGQGDNGRLMSEESFGLMTGPGIWAENCYYGYALAIYSVNGRTCIGHGGGSAGHRSSIMVDMAAGLAVVFLLNLTGDTEPINDAVSHVLTHVLSAQREVELPPLPPARTLTSIANAVDYAGVYRSGNLVFRLTASEGKLWLRDDDRNVALERRGEDCFYIGHPDFALFLLELKRDDGEVVEAFHGPDWYINDRYSGSLQVAHPEEWAAYTGHYRARNPEVSNFRIVLRKGNLVLIFPSGMAESLSPIDHGSFRIGQDKSSPESLRFDAVVGGHALLADYSGCPYYRTFTP